MAKKKNNINLNETFDEIGEIVKETITIQELDPITKECIECGKEFTISPAEQKFYISHDYIIPKRCPVCRKEKNELIELTCVDCNKRFTITKSEKSSYERNGLFVPKRCPVCLKFKKEKNNLKKEKCIKA